LVEIKGLEKFAPKDFPGHLAATVFLGGCNFRCPYCHNADLAARPETLATLPADYFMSFLDSRKGWLEGVCVTGGEPLLSPDLEVLLHVIKDRGLLVKLDTNGSFPARLEALIHKELIDRVAMDVKAPLERYRELTRSDVDVKDILRSIDIICASGLPYVFRTTVVPGLIEADDLQRIGRILSGTKVFQIQQFSPFHDTMDEGLRGTKPYSREKMEEFAELLRPHFEEIRIEGD